MTSEPRAALDRLIAALEGHLAAVSRRQGEADPAVVTAYQTLADAFEAYDEALYDAFDEVTPFVLYDDAEDAVDEDDDETLLDAEGLLEDDDDDLALDLEDEDDDAEDDDAEDDEDDDDIDLSGDVPGEAGDDAGTTPVGDPEDTDAGDLVDSTGARGESGRTP